MAKPTDTPRRGSTKALGDLAPKLLDPAARRQGFVRSAILAHWPQIVGPAYAVDTLPIKLQFPPGEKRGGSLTVLIDGAAATLFRHVEPEVLDRINGYFGYRAVDRLILRHGALPPADQSRLAPIPPPLPPKAAEELERLAERIEDPGLRSSVASLGRLVLG